MSEEEVLNLRTFLARVHTDIESTRRREELSRKRFDDLIQEQLDLLNTDVEVQEGDSTILLRLSKKNRIESTAASLENVVDSLKNRLNSLPDGDYTIDDIVTIRYLGSSTGLSDGA